ncbi:hypothetical protein E2C01_008338 [Portunus trituberculatus]|uniref:Uncharacterized protein n=1 Tax=Portunus trituberculatus TaxID=210409 RepID=A0A5B7D0I1_PORTR|nr:hypothetical protein [Portunus trituberculatus]
MKNFNSQREEEREGQAQKKCSALETDVMAVVPSGRNKGHPSWLRQNTTGTSVLGDPEEGLEK